jgi:hypothetical protein
MQILKANSSFSPLKKQFLRSSSNQKFYWSIRVFPRCISKYFKFSSENKTEDEKENLKLLSAKKENEVQSYKFVPVPDHPLLTNYATHLSLSQQQYKVQDSF